MEINDSAIVNSGARKENSDLGYRVGFYSTGCGNVFLIKWVADYGL
jgi:hypothetical protein